MNDFDHQILILDDDHIFTQMMSDYLSMSAHCCVDLAHAEEQFWSAYEKKSYDLIFMDYRLPESTGIEILEKLSALNNKTPVVMMTAEGTEEVAVRAMQTGAFDYLVKGHYSISTLPSLIIRATRQRRLQDQMEKSLLQIDYQASLLEKMRDAIVVWDAAGVINYWNQAAVDLFGDNPEDQIGQNIHDSYLNIFTPPVSDFKDAFDSPLEMERKFISPQGEMRWISSIITPLFNEKETEIIGYMDVSRDISAKKTIENQLQQRLIMEKLLSSISNFFININPQNTDVGVEKTFLLIGNYLRPDYGAIFLLEEQNRLTYFTGFEKAIANSQKISLGAGQVRIEDFPYLRQKLKGQEPILINELADLPEEASVEKALFIRHNIKSILLVPMIHNNELIGSVVMFNTKRQQNWQPDHSHLLQSFADMVVNAIVQKRTAEALRSSEARYRTIVEEHQTELICRLNTKYQFTFVNEKFCNYFGETRESMALAVAHRYVHSLDYPKVEAELKTLSPENNVARLEFRCIRDNTIRWLEWTIRAIFDDARNLLDYQGIGRDVTERIEMENQLKTAQTHLAQNSRMAAIGELASSIAHQISNPLTTIIAESQILSQTSKNDASLSESIAAIEQAGWRAQHVIQELLKFSEPTQGSNELFCVNETIDKALLLTSAHIKASGNTSLHVSLAQDLPLVRGNFQQLEDLWVTLLILARNATCYSHSHQISITTQPAVDPPGMWIILSDDGIPIQESMLEHIFEPQLIPTGLGRGTGIELSLCREIIRQHQGTISAKIIEGTTVFEIYLPGR